MCLRSTLKGILLILWLFVQPVAVLCASADAEHIRIGVLAKRGTDHCKAKWYPTAVYLSKTVPSHQFVIDPLEFASVPQAVAEKRIDFILIDSSYYVELEDQYGIDSIATLVNRMHGSGQKLFGGVIFTRSDRFDILTLNDLPGKAFMAVKERSLGGWRMAWRELKEAGVDPLKDFQTLSFGGTDDAVVYAIQNRKADAGTVRTSTLECMAAEGKIDLKEFRVLNINEAARESFGSFCSTRLYPEWPMAKLPHTSIKLAEKVAQALFHMEDHTPAAKAANIAGWTYPLSYHTVHDCHKDLQLSPYNPNIRISIGDFFHQHKIWIVTVAIVFLAICFSVVCVAKLNTKLSLINTNLMREVEKRKQIEAGLLDSETRLQTIIDCSIAGILIIDPETDTITDANKSTLDMVGADKNAMVGRKYYHVIRKVDQKKTFIEVNSTQKFDRCEGRLTRADGTEKAILLTATPFTIHGKTYLLNSFIDISKLKDTQFNLESALAAANEANKSKNNFLANMSHELRTPMNGIIGMTGILQNTDLNSEQMEFAQIIMKSAEGLLGIINDILDYANIAAGQSKLESTEFDLFSLINNEMASISPKVEEKGLVLSHVIENSVPTFLKGDARRIKKIIRILMSNAVKFTNQGTISLQALLTEDTIDYCTLRILVKDTGIGIPPERKEQIFNPFSQIDYSSTRQYSGTGLGLALAKHFTEMMGGNIGFESTQTSGSTFWFTVQLKKQKALSIRPSYNVASINPQRILIVDDNNTNRQVLEGYFKSWLLPYTAVGSARSALAALHKAASDKMPFDLAIIDHAMPGMDGLDLGRAITNEPLLKNVKMILFSSIDQGLDIDEIETAGFSAYITKPVRSSKLLNCIKLVCYQQNGEQQTTPPPGRLITHDVLKAVEVEKPQILVVEDNVINQRVMQKILENLGCHTEIVDNGRKAVIALCKKAYDLVFMDLQMPVMNGFEATSAIRNPQNKCLDPQIPIIAVTANSMRGEPKRCLDAGMNDYMPKPVSPKALQEKVRQWHENKRLLPQPPNSTYN